MRGNATGKRRVAILISGRGSNMRALVEATATGGLQAEIVAVVSNRPDAPGLEWAAAKGLATEALDHRSYSDRAAFESALQAVLDRFDVDLVCLAGFMRLLTPEFTRRWEGRMLNIHPSLLPAFKGLDTHARAIKAGVTFTGCTVHFVTAEMDAGPIIVQAAVPVLPADTPDTLASRVLEAEHAIYPWALSAVADGRAMLENGRVSVTSSNPPDLAFMANPAG